mmetsp:Transcript_23193/g.64397  ORF Transcript_23193/g.64397 Transcript_23193/m.64397 type:complete len:634 (-) Transcript_23193:217-2118(-)|eukprot:CAMPEP_0117657158 /NCGR_PEP_ID=MMETSP0804-20121206/5184_1 /TAXON_ID=1074897 /ORGANISM="Tetraselmis astigmatica, Strain CCMP880" /LENGTH=633 /DNA_ID=CAMNT_0005463599 /DNA_START=261 /DNA_END=2162 /DNA_ORIENTATION=-
MGATAAALRAVFLLALFSGHLGADVAQLATESLGCSGGCISGVDARHTTRKILQSALPPIDETMTPWKMTQRWESYHVRGDGTCGADCLADKQAMCELLPVRCARLRCKDIAKGRSATEDTEKYQPACTLLERNRLEAPLEAAQMVLTWRAFHTTGDGQCGEECMQDKVEMCYKEPLLCVALRCEDEREGRSATALKAVCTDALTVWQALNRISKEPEDKAIAAGDGHDEKRNRFRLNDNMQCGYLCKQTRASVCEDNSLLCMELLCEDAWVLAGDASLLPACGAFYPPPAKEPEVSAQSKGSAESLEKEWKKLRAANFAGCSAACEARKQELCKLDPALCLTQRCAEIGTKHGLDALDVVCGGVKSSFDISPEVRAATTKIRAVVTRWRNLVTFGQYCGEVCQDFKLQTCLNHSNLCIALTCDDERRRTKGKLPVALDSVCGRFLDEFEDELRPKPQAAAQAAVDAKRGGSTSAARVEGAASWWETLTQMQEKQWRELVTGQDCGEACEEFKLELCNTRPNLCVRLTCEDAVIGADLKALRSCLKGGELSRQSDIVSAAQAAAARPSDNDRRFRWEWEDLEQQWGCDGYCQRQRASMCAESLPMCLQMRCMDGDFSGANPVLQDDICPFISA